MHSELPCCLFIDLSFLIITLMRVVMQSNLRDEEGQYVGIAPRKVGRAAVQNGILTFLVLTAFYASLFYLIHYEPNVHAGLPVPWTIGLQWILSPLLTGMLFLFLGTLYMVKMYKPDT